MKVRCPKCQKTDTVSFSKHTITCQNCQFCVTYDCPICNTPLNTHHFHPTEKNTDKDILHCTGCNNKIPTEKIQYLIENHLYIDHQKRCHLCNGPTIHRKK